MCAPRDHSAYRGPAADDFAEDALDSTLVRVLKNDPVIQNAHGVGIVRIGERDAARQSVPARVPCDGKLTSDA